MKLSVKCISFGKKGFREKCDLVTDRLTYIQSDHRGAPLLKTFEVTIKIEWLCSTGCGVVCTLQDHAWLFIRVLFLFSSTGFVKYWFGEHFIAIGPGNSKLLYFFFFWNANFSYLLTSKFKCSNVQLTKSQKEKRKQFWNPLAEGYKMPSDMYV